MHLNKTENLDLFLLQNARKGGYESHNISPVPKGTPGLPGQTVVISRVPAAK